MPQKPTAVQFAEDPGDPARPVDVLHVVIVVVGRNLGQAGHAPSELRNVFEVEVDSALVGDGICMEKMTTSTSIRGAIAVLST